MGGFLYFSGILLIMASFICSALSGQYGIITFPIVFALGCIVLGLGKIIKLLSNNNSNI